MLFAVQCNVKYLSLFYIVLILLAGNTLFLTLHTSPGIIALQFQA